MKERPRVPCRHGSGNRPCRAYAVHGSDPPRCASHGGCSRGPASVHAPLRPVTGLPVGDAAEIEALAGEGTLDAEIGLARLALRRVLALLQAADGEDGLGPEQVARLTRVAMDAARTVARLMRDRRALSGEAADGFAQTIAQALDELGTQMGLPL